MPFANCQRCGRLFHHLDPVLPAGYQPNAGQDDASHELCPECLTMTRDDAHNPDPNVNAARIVGESTASVNKG